MYLLQGTIKMLVTVNKIRIVHDLSCHRISYIANSALLRCDLLQNNRSSDYVDRCVLKWKIFLPNFVKIRF